MLVQSLLSRLIIQWWFWFWVVSLEFTLSLLRRWCRFFPGHCKIKIWDLNIWWDDWFVDLPGNLSLMVVNGVLFAWLSWAMCTLGISPLEICTHNLLMAILSWESVLVWITLAEEGLLPLAVKILLRWSRVTPTASIGSASAIPTIFVIVVNIIVVSRRLHFKMLVI